MSNPAPRIYLVAIDDAVRKGIVDNLAALGFAVCGAVGREEIAADPIVAAHPDILLLDIGLADDP